MCKGSRKIDNITGNPVMFGKEITKEECQVVAEWMYLQCDKITNGKLLETVAKVANFLNREHDNIRELPE